MRSCFLNCPRCQGNFFVKSSDFSGDTQTCNPCDFLYLVEWEYLEWHIDRWPFHFHSLVWDLKNKKECRLHLSHNKGMIILPLLPYDITLNRLKLLVSYT